MLPLAGVAGFESEALSGFVAAAAWREVESEGESLTSFIGVSASSLAACETGSRRVRSLSDETLRVTSLEVALDDLRRSFAEPAVLLDGAIASVVSRRAWFNTLESLAGRVAEAR